MKKLKLIASFLLCTTLFCSCIKQDIKTISNPIRIPTSLEHITFDDNIPISIAFWQIQDMVHNSHSDAILEYIEDLFHITITPVSMNWSNYRERYKVLYATNSLPDVFANLSIPSTDKGIRSLPDDLTKFPHIKTLLDKLNYSKYTAEKNYFIPRESFVDPVFSTSDAAMIVRKDWMDNLGLSNPRSLDEFIDFVTAFAKEDPDGNGIHDTIGYNVNELDAIGKWLLLGIAPESNVYGWVEKENGYIPAYFTEEFKQVVLAYRTLYERGGLDPDFYQKKSSDALYDFAHGKLGALEYKSSPAAIMKLQSIWEIYNDLPFEDCVDIIHIFPAPDGIYYSNSSKNFWSETYFSSNVDDNTMERILYLMDYLLSEEGSNLINYGIEGIDYEKKNGQITYLLDTSNTSITQVLQTKYPSLLLFSNLASWGGTKEDFQINTRNNILYGEYATKLSVKDFEWNIAHTTQVDRPYDYMLMPKEDHKSYQKENLKNDFIKTIIGKDDPLIMWESFLDKYYSMGLEDYIERQNNLYNRYLNNHQ